MVDQERNVSIHGPCGAIEALYHDGADAVGAALLCHPHPLYGGTLQNKVVTTLQRAARDAGYATLRFNFRGVGNSAGAYGEGIGEIDDAYAAAQWLLQRHRLPLTVMGFSFGACVAGNLAARLEADGQALAHLFMLAPPVARFAVKLPEHCPLTIVQPEQDEVVEPAAVYAWSEGLKEMHDLISVPGSSHFFHGKLVELKAVLSPILRGERDD